MANIVYLTLKGETQGLISAGCSSLQSVGNKAQVSHRDQILVYAPSHSISRVQNFPDKILEPGNVGKLLSPTSPSSGANISPTPVPSASDKLRFCNIWVFKKHNYRCFNIITQHTQLQIRN